MPKPKRTQGDEPKPSRAQAEHALSAPPSRKVQADEELNREEANQSWAEVQAFFQKKGVWLTTVRELSVIGLTPELATAGPQSTPAEASDYASTSYALRFADPIDWRIRISLHYASLLIDPIVISGKLIVTFDDQPIEPLADGRMVLQIPHSDLPILNQSDSLLYYLQRCVRFLVSY